MTYIIMIAFFVIRQILFILFAKPSPARGIFFITSTFRMAFSGQSYTQIESD